MEGLLGSRGLAVLSERLTADRSRRSSRPVGPSGGADYSFHRLQGFISSVCQYVRVCIAVIAITQIITMTMMMITISNNTELSLDINVDVEC